MGAADADGQGSGKGDAVVLEKGGAQLVRHLSGKVELRGGIEEDRRAACEWVANFMPELLTALQSPSGQRKK